MLVRPGEIIAVVDPNVSGYRSGGRVKSYNPSTGVVVLDIQHYVNRGATIYTLRSDGSARKTLVYNTFGTTTNQIVTDAGLDGIDYGTPYLIFFDDILEPQQYRVRSIEEDTESGSFTITAIEHNPSKFNAVDFDAPVENLPVSVIPSPFDKPPTPSDLVVEELLVQQNNSIITKLDVTWGQSRSYYPCNYLVRRRSVHTWTAPASGGAFSALSAQILADLAAQNWFYESPTPANSLQIANVRPGYYQFEVTAVNPYNIYSDPSQLTLYVYGLTKPPATPTNFRLAGSDSVVSLSWDQSPDLDVRVGGAFEIRFSRYLTSTWSGATVIGTAAGSATSMAFYSGRNGVFLIKAVDSSGIYSLEAASIELYSTISNTNYIYERNFDITGGTTLHLAPFFDELARTTSLRLTSQAYFDSVDGTFDATPGLFDSAGGTFDYLPVTTLLDRATDLFDSLSGTNTLNKLGYWYDTDIFDMGDIYSCKLTGDVKFDTFSVQDDFLSFQGLFDDRPGLFDGQNPDVATAVVEFSSTNDLISWSDYTRVSGIDVTARAFKFRIAATTSVDPFNLNIYGGEVEVDLPERLESGSVITNAYAIAQVNFPSGGFYQVPEISITMQNARTGDYFVVTDLRTTGFKIAAYNGSYLLSNAISREFNYVVRGIGKTVA
jgi:hypothetical protein